jgi:hypothetical protein
MRETFNQKSFLRAAFSVLLMTSVFLSPLWTLAQDDDGDKSGNVVAKIDFDPKIHGFGFENYTNSNHNWQDDLGAADMIKLFGADKVCKEGTTAADCVLNAATREWMMKQLEGMNGGHCEGMAVTALRFFRQQQFNGKAKPADFQSGAAETFKLKLDQPIENYIAYYFVTQMLDEVSNPTQQTRGGGPAGIVDLLVENFQKDSPDLYALGIYKFENGEKKDGHAITPIGVEDMGEGLFRIHVYDNNYVGEVRYVEVDKNKNTWKYRTATNPNEAADDYIGDAATQTLEITLNSWREPNGFFVAPFANNAESEETVVETEEQKSDAENTDDGEQEQNEIQAKGDYFPRSQLMRRAAPAQNDEVEFAFNGEGSILITDASGKRVGFDVKAKKFINELKADVIAQKGGKGKDIPPVYQLPYNKEGKPYTVQISGKDLKRETDGDLYITGPGYSVGFEGILLDPNETLTMTVSPDGRELSFTSSADGETPEVYFAIDPNPNSASYIFEIDGMEIEAGKTVFAKLDTRTGKLDFKDNDGSEDQYDVRMFRINPDGTEEEYIQNDLETGKSDNYEMEFGKWDGKSPLCFKDDDDGNGFTNDECEAQTNESPRKPATKK